MASALNMNQISLLYECSFCGLQELKKLYVNTENEIVLYTMHCGPWARKKKVILRNSSIKITGQVFFLQPLMHGQADIPIGSSSTSRTL